MIDTLIARFGIQRQRVDTRRIVHTETIAVLNRDGSLREIVRSTNSDPAALLQIAREADGQEMPWLQHGIFWLGQNADALCGRPSAATSITVGVILACLLLACLPACVLVAFCYSSSNCVSNPHNDCIQGDDRPNVRKRQRRIHDTEP